MAISLVPLTAVMRPGTTRRGRVLILWGQFLLLAGVLGLILGMLGLVLWRFFQ
jgi:hypothetical protein